MSTLGTFAVEHCRQRFKPLLSFELIKVFRMYVYGCVLNRGHKASPNVDVSFLWPLPFEHQRKTGKLFLDVMYFYPRSILGKKTQAKFHLASSTLIMWNKTGLFCIF